MEYGELYIQDNTKIDFSCINILNNNVYYCYDHFLGILELLFMVKNIFLVVEESCLVLL